MKTTKNGDAYTITASYKELRDISHALLLETSRANSLYYAAKDDGVRAAALQVKNDYNDLIRAIGIDAIQH
jgi:hypothetical protein